MEFVIISLLWICVCAAMLILGRPAVMGRIGRNSWIGIRTPETIDSDRAWRRAHEIAWPAQALFTSASLVLTLIGIGLSLSGQIGDELSVLALILAVLLWLWGYVFALRQVRQADLGGPDAGAD